METKTVKSFYRRLDKKNKLFPINGQIELTYRCNLDCIHCYCKGSEDEKKELTASEFKKILNEIQKEGCLCITLTGGEPLIRPDFLEIYAYAKSKGLIVTIFTNGLLFTEKILEYFKKSPPYSVEITLNGITKNTYESITQVNGSFRRIVEAIKKLKKQNLPLILKTNCLKQNKNDIGKIKSFVDRFLGRANGKYHFKYDTMIYPRLNGDKTPTQFRLSFEEMLNLRKQDPDIWQEYKEIFCADFPDLNREDCLLYRCNAWIEHFFIDPFGRLKFCQYSDKFSTDLKTGSFREGFYKTFPKLLSKKFKTSSKCQDCHLRHICYQCPAKAYLETGNEEAPVEYYCQCAKAFARTKASQA